MRREDCILWKCGSSRTGPDKQDVACAAERNGHAARYCLSGKIAASAGTKIQRQIAACLQKGPSDEAGAG